MDEEKIAPNNGWLKSFLIFIFFVAAIGGTVWYVGSLQCSFPVKFAVGQIDQRFKLSESDIKLVGQDAASRWDQTLNKDVLEYDPNASLKINLVYDERQSKVDQLNSESAKIGQSAQSVESFRQKFKSLLSSYEKDLANYNAKVESWNNQGGAPHDVYSELQKESKDLEQRRVSLNNVASLLNTQIDQHNSNLGQFNQEVETQSNKLITQGLYYEDQNKIDIFTYYDKEELRLVLMHELGHAMGIDEHTTNEKSIMFAVLEKQNLKDPQPLEEDIAAISNKCNLSNNFSLNNLEIQFKAVIRNLSLRLKSNGVQ
ncbi:MAG: matrixin family metalloprotease [Candidatus Berkelbacteria bacterium]|nr:matrixin family metalloprotease [Candidatus Berkelbacteria bacterium]